MVPTTHDNNLNFSPLRIFFQECSFISQLGSDHSPLSLGRTCGRLARQPESMTLGVFFYDNVNTLLSSKNPLHSDVTDLFVHSHSLN